MSKRKLWLKKGPPYANSTDGLLIAGAIIFGLIAAVIAL